MGLGGRVTGKASGSKFGCTKYVRVYVLSQDIYLCFSTQAIDASYGRGRRLHSGRWLIIQEFALFGLKAESGMNGIHSCH
jgi:hypothetical protein